MDFNSHKPIYLQICDQIYERILTGELRAEDRIMSVRELGASLGVNPNTVMRSYETLQNNEIIYNKRGIGYFITENAREIVLMKQKENFINEELPAIFKKMALFDIKPEEIVKLYNEKISENNKGGSINSYFSSASSQNLIKAAANGIFTSAKVI